jgi:hypothetical protein
MMNLRQMFSVGKFKKKFVSLSACAYRLYSVEVILNCTKVSGAGLPDGLFSYQKSLLGIFWRVLEWKMLVYFMTILNILLPFDIFYGRWV